MTPATILNSVNCAKAKRCNEMSLQCAQTYKGSDRPWGNLTQCYSLKGNTLMNSLGEPEKKYNKIDFDNCTKFFSGKNPCKEGFVNQYIETDNIGDSEKMNEVVVAINDSNGVNRIRVQQVLDEYVVMKTKRDLVDIQLDEMNSTNTDLNLETNSLIYTTLFTTALGTCLLFYFIKNQ